MHRPIWDALLADNFKLSAMETARWLVLIETHSDTRNRGGASFLRFAIGIECFIIGVCFDLIKK